MCFLEIPLSPPLRCLQGGGRHDYRRGDWNLHRVWKDQLDLLLMSQWCLSKNLRPQQQSQKRDKLLNLITFTPEIRKTIPSIALTWKLLIFFFFLLLNITHEWVQDRNQVQLGENKYIFIFWSSSLLKWC